MTYVTEQTSAELRAHMRRLQAIPGWHNPLDDRLFKEIQALDAEIAALRSTLPPIAITAEEAGREGEAKDTERLDWLEKHFTHISGICLDSLNCVQHFEVDCEEDTLESGTTRIREAIDAAMLPPAPAQSGGQGNG